MSADFPPFGTDQKRAIRELQFVTVTKARDKAIATDRDPNRLAAAGFSAYRYERSAGNYDYDGTCANPEVIAWVAQQLGLAE